MAQKYELTDAHRAQLPAWRDKWIANAMSTAAMTEHDRGVCRDAVRRMYRASNLEPPPDERIVFVSSPFVGRYAGGFAAWIEHCRKNPKVSAKSRKAAARAATDTATRAATAATAAATTYAATRAATFAATSVAISEATRATTAAATVAATYAATATDAISEAASTATRAATFAATSVAISEATRATTAAATVAATYATAATDAAATYAATRAATFAATSVAISEATRAATAAATVAATYAATATDAISEAASTATRAATFAATSVAISEATRAATVAATVAATYAATATDAAAATYDTAADAVSDALDRWYVFPDMRSVADALGVGAAGLMCAERAWSMWQNGNQWSDYDSFISFFRHVAKLPLDYSAWDAWETLSLSSGPRIVHSDFCIISDRPEFLSVDERNRPHNETGPFCRWRDGAALYSVHGVRVPAWVIERPDRLSVAAIDAEENAEVQRVMIERFGWDRYAEECGAKAIDHDERWGTLCRTTAGRLFVRVVNRSPEPDGSFRRYILPVLDQCEPLPDPDDPNGVIGEPQELTALAAVASTFGMRAKEYAAAVGAES